MNERAVGWVGVPAPGLTNACRAVSVVHLLCPTADLTPDAGCAVGLGHRLERGTPSSRYLVKPNPGPAPCASVGWGSGCVRRRSQQLTRRCTERLSPGGLYENKGRQTPGPGLAARISRLRPRRHHPLAGVTGSGCHRTGLPSSRSGGRISPGPLAQGTAGARQPKDLTKHSRAPAGLSNVSGPDWAVPPWLLLTCWVGSV